MHGSGRGREGGVAPVAPVAPGGGAPQVPGEGGGLPRVPGEGGITPAGPGRGGVAPAAPGEGGGIKQAPGEGGVIPSAPGASGTVPSLPGEGGIAPAAPGEGGFVPSASVDREFLALERELAVFLRRARAQSGEMAREVHPELEPAAYGLFVRLDDAGPQRATELAGYFGVGKATMSRQLRALEDLGLVARDPDPADGRASLVRLTEEGRNRFRRVRDARRERYVRKLADWDRAEVAELARLLNHFNVRSEG